MYNYHKLNGWSYLPLSNPQDDLLVNGRSLSDIEGYRQLHISGRGIVPMNAYLVEVPGRPGAFFNYSQDEVREIEVTFQLSGKSSNHLRDQYEALNNRLREVNEEGMLSLRFIDEPEWEYFGVLTEADDKPEQSLQLIDSFKLICPSPLKYRTEQSSAGIIRLKHANQVLPELIEGTVSNATDYIAFKNNDLRIGLKGNYNKGDKVRVEWFKDHVDITVNSVNKLHELSFFSYPETFFIKDKDHLSGIDIDINKVIWRDRRL